MALAAQWVSRILTVCLVIIAPGILGQWLDRRWETNFLALLGFAFGLVTGMYYLLVMTGAIRGGDQRKGVGSEPDGSEQKEADSP